MMMVMLGVGMLLLVVVCTVMLHDEDSWLTGGSNYEVVGDEALEPNVVQKPLSSPNSRANTIFLKT
jgi:hypothetical protein